MARHVEEFEELLKKEKEEKLEAYEELQRYCEEAVEARGLKIKLNEQLAQIEVLKEETRKAGRNEVREQIEA